MQRFTGSGGRGARVGCVCVIAEGDSYTCLRSSAFHVRKNIFLAPPPGPPLRMEEGTPLRVGRGNDGESTKAEGVKLHSVYTKFQGWKDWQ